MSFPGNPPTDRTIAANAGVTIKRLASGNLLVRPSKPTAQLQPRILNALPAVLLDRPTRLLRHFASQQRWLTYLLYYDLRFGNWFIWLPPQRSICTDEHIVDLNFCNADQVPCDDFRLAGSFGLAGHRFDEDWPASVPHFDGLHLFLQPANWGTLTAVIVAGGEPMLIEPRGMLIDRLDDIDRTLLKNVKTV